MHEMGDGDVAGRKLGISVLLGMPRIKQRSTIGQSGMITVARLTDQNEIPWRQTNISRSFFSILTEPQRAAAFAQAKSLTK